MKFLFYENDLINTNEIKYVTIKNCIMIFEFYNHPDWSIFGEELFLKKIFINLLRFLRDEDCIYCDINYYFET